jgi:hypothetical protein
LAPDNESLVCMPSMCSGRLSRGFAESTAVMKLKGVRLDKAEQTTAGRTKVLRTGCDNSQVRLVSAGWAGRWIARQGETRLELSVDATQKTFRAN